MATSLFDILQSKNFDEPPEAAAIKKFVSEKYHKTIAVTVRDKEIIIEAQGAAFVNTLRMQWKQLSQAANTDKRLLFRIS